MDTNKVVNKGFSNPDTRNLYEQRPSIDDRIRCISCSFYGKLHSYYGLCCYRRSNFYLETLFRYFGCDKYVSESRTFHSFEEDNGLLIRRSCLLSFIRSCKRAIDGRKGIGFVSEEIQQLYLEMNEALSQWPDECD